MSRFQLAYSNGHHRPFIWTFEQKVTHDNIQLAYLDTKSAIFGIHTRNVLVRADLRLKNWHWSSNAKKLAFFISKKIKGFFHNFFSHIHKLLV